MHVFVILVLTSFVVLCSCSHQEKKTEQITFPKSAFTLGVATNIAVFLSTVGTKLFLRVFFFFVSFLVKEREVLPEGKREMRCWTNMLPKYSVVCCCHRGFFFLCLTTSSHIIPQICSLWLCCVTYTHTLCVHTVGTLCLLVYETNIGGVYFFYFFCDKCLERSLTTLHVKRLDLNVCSLYFI